LRKVATFITKRFGTSFRNSQMAHAKFSKSKIHNADFTNADISLVNWGDSKKANCISGNSIITDKKKKSQGEGKVVGEK
jgi:uncharacterized protein YjbI with pentapeptide repeats